MVSRQMKKDENGNYVEHTTRGYEVTGDYFFVDDIIHIYVDGKPKPDTEGQPCLRQNTVYFDSFQEYYSYVDRDIYTQACYMGWTPSPELLRAFHIKWNKLNNASLQTDTINNHTWSLNDAVKELRIRTKQDEKTFIRMQARLNQWRVPSDIKKTLDYFKEHNVDYWKFRIILSQYFETNKEAEDLALESVRQNCIPNTFIYDFLAYSKQPGVIAEAYQPSSGSAKTIRKYKKQITAAAQAFEDFEGHISDTRAFYISGGYFVIATYLLSDDGQKHVSIKAFKDYFQFVHSLNNDLSGIDLSECTLDDVDFTQYKTNEKTILPLTSVSSISYSVEHGFRDSAYYVQQEWRDEKGVRRHHETHSFAHFADYVHFIGGTLEHADFSMMSTDAFERIQTIGISLSGIIPPTVLETIDTTEFDKTAQNEKESQPILKAFRPKEGELISSESLFPRYRYDGGQILYLTDLHLDHIIYAAKCKTIGDVQAVLDRIGKNLDKSYREYVSLSDDNVVVVIGGDIAHSPVIFEQFLALKYRFLRKSIILLGNHELWAYPGLSVDEVVDKYRELTPEHVTIAYNEIILFEDKFSNQNYASEYIDYNIRSISYDEAMNMTANELSNEMQAARIAMLTGIGFSGRNPTFNADNGIYRDTVSREMEITETIKFDTLYKHFIAATRLVSGRVLVVATHMPLDCWSEIPIYVNDIIYISGHTHRNYFHDDGVQRVYADNQNGYRGRHPTFKCIYIDDVYDPFITFAEGIYDITKKDYIRFYQARKMNMQLNRDYENIYMLKRNGYYCFLARLKSGKLSILNGGRGSSVSVPDVEFYYQQMDKQIEGLLAPLKQYTALQKQVSDAVKSFGGSGSIHGCIVDIDYYNHIYVNPYDLTIKGYYALNMIVKWVYNSIPVLLKSHSPELYKNFERLPQSDLKRAIFPLETKELLTEQEGELYLETDIYRASREISKIQRLHNNVLTVWSDSLFEDGKPKLPLL